MQQNEDNIKTRTNVGVKYLWVARLKTSCQLFEKYHSYRFFIIYLKYIFSLIIFTYQMVYGRCHHAGHKEFIHRTPQDAFLAHRNHILLWKCMISKKSIDIWHVIMNSRVHYCSEGNSRCLRLHFAPSHAIIIQCSNLMSLVLCPL